MTRSNYCEAMSEIMFQFSQGIITAKQKDEEIEKLNLRFSEGVEQLEMFNNKVVLKGVA